MPHPNDRRVLLQIQVYPGRGKTALDVLENGLKQLIDVTSHVKNVFEVSAIFASPDVSLD